MDKAKEEIISKLPAEIGTYLNSCQWENLQEIRFRTQRPVMLYYGDKIEILNKSDKKYYICEKKDIEKLVSNFCRNSVYAYSDNLRDGFVTLPGGHRVGISGRAVYSNGRLSNITSYSGLNIRIAREYKGVFENYIKYIKENERILSTIIISPPGGGKTTLLRDIARILGESHKVTIIDERSEIAAQEFGVPQFDVGIQTDVLDGYTKDAGIRHALRSLSPDVIITDEIGTKSDISAIENILKGGCKIITSMHGYSIEEIREKKGEFLSLFEVAVTLERHEVTKCLKL